MHIILHQPEIPANTGNIGRTCVATGTSLHLIEPLGFRLNEKEIKRADVKFGPDDYIMFGKESAGIPEEILVEHEETCIRIPMLPEIRSLNLSNSVAIVLYEALRQQGFESMQRDGELHRLHWKES